MASSLLVFLEPVGGDAAQSIYTHDDALAFQCRFNLRLPSDNLPEHVEDDDDENDDQ